MHLKRDGRLSYFFIRLMCQEDVAQVSEIDREAFPTQLPPPNYHHELENRLAHYIVTCDEEKIVTIPEVKASAEKGLAGLTPRWRRLFGISRFFENERLPASGDYITGFVGFWFLADEAHILSIAVREAYRRRGIGDLLLISALDLAIELKARIVTLEVRVSNTAAQSLYTKYNFIKIGVRRGYYTDNREDAILMSAQNITSASFQACFQQLKQAHSRNGGLASIKLPGSYPAQPDNQ